MYFILNIKQSAFLCVYPSPKLAKFEYILWQILSKNRVLKACYLFFQIELLTTQFEYWDIPYFFLSSSFERIL